MAGFKMKFDHVVNEIIRPMGHYLQCSISYVIFHPYLFL